MVFVVETITMPVEYNEAASACDTFNVRIQLRVVVLGVEPYVHEGRRNLKYGYRLIQYRIKRRVWKNNSVKEFVWIVIKD